MLLSLIGYFSNSQILVRGISPASIANSYQFTWADPYSGWATPDFYTQGVFVEDTLMVVEDGSAGINPQGFPISQEGCNPLINNLTGKIAVIYRNSCEFSLKALNAQNAGAVGVIIINNVPSVVAMGAGANSANVTIPVVMLTPEDGAILVAEMANGAVVVSMGNRCSMNGNFQIIDTSFCDSYTAPSGQIYTQSGSYYYILPYIDGCDSVGITINFTLIGERFLEASFQVSPSYCTSPTGSITASFVGIPIQGNSAFISEYYVGNASDFVLEIYNSTNSDFDISAVQYYDYLGTLIPYYFQLQNNSNQLFSFPPNTVIPALGTILISNPNSLILGDLTSSIIDGSAVSIIGNAGPILGIQVFDIVEPALNQTRVRKESILDPNPTFNLSDWNSLPLSSESLNSGHNYTNFNYQIQWFNGSLNNTLSNISEGNYSYTVVDSVSGCILETGVVNVPNISNNFNPTFSSTQQLYTAPPFVVQFSNSTANAANYSFTWDFGDGATLASNNASVFHQYSFNGLYTVSLVATDNVTGCTDTTTITDYIYCTGGASCTHTAAISQQGPLQACAGTDVWLSCNNDPSFTYQWRRNGINIPGNNNDSLLVIQTGNYTVSIYVNSCPVTSNGISVTINPLPSIPTITPTGTITSCSGGSLTLAAPAGLSSYSWNTGATSSSINVTLSGNYSVTVTNANGCVRTSAPYVVNASFMPSPNVCIVGMDSLTNENRIVWEKPITTGIDSFYVYKETNVSDIYTKIGATNYPDLAVFLDQNSNPAVQAYRYKLTVLDTCGTETLLSDFHKTIHLTINAGVGGAWNLIWSHYEGLTFGSYNIYRGTNPTNISLLTTIQSNLNSYTDLTPPVGPVYYQIEIVNPNSCDPAKVVNYDVSKSNIVNNGVNGINALANTSVLVYPNPTSKDVTLEITSELLGKDYCLTDNTGRIILSSQFRALKETINLEQIATGVYFIKIDDNANLMYKIVKN
jgi:hypothetical protein